MGMREVKSSKYRQERMVPTLDGLGWVAFNNKEKIDYLLADFFTADAAQSTLYRNLLSTFQSISARDIGSLSLLRDNMESYLSIYLNAHVPNTKVDVSMSDLQGNPKDFYELDDHSRIGIAIDITYTENQMEFKEFKKYVTYEKGVFYYVLEKFNTGV